jgi:hypothetical protein
VVEIYKHRRLVSGKVAFAEIDAYPEEVLERWHGQTHLAFEKLFEPWTDPTTGLSTPFAYVKTATPDQEHNKYFGGNYCRAERLIVHSID